MSRTASWGTRLSRTPSSVSRIQVAERLSRAVSFGRSIGSRTT